MAIGGFTLGSLLQYVVLGVLGYILAGAPLLSVITGPTEEGKKSRAGYGFPPPLSHDKAATLIIPERNLSCEEHAFRGVHLLSREPLVVYVEGFLDEEEARHVVDVRYVVWALI